MDVTDVVKDITQLFWSMRPDYECHHVTEPTHGLLGHPAECHLLKVYHKEVGNDR
jgi:hypothetical protein